MSPYLLVFVTALVVSLLLTPAARWLSFRWGLVAVPGGRRRHGQVMPQFGGLPLAAAFLVAAALAWALAPPVGDDATRLRGVLLGGVVMFGGGLLDDRLELSPRVNFLIQFVGAGIAMSHIIFIELFTNPLNGEWVWIRPRVLALAFTLFWMVGMINTINFLDGLDGLAAGVGTIAALLFAWHSYNLAQTTVALFPLALAGALLGFLPFNFTPARIFLGSAGAYFLGYQLATLSILAPAKIATALLVMAVPILDVGWQVFNRLRQGRSPFQGDRGHLHYRLADAGISTPHIVLGYYAVSAAFGLVAILGTAKIKLVLLAALTVVVLLFFFWLSRRVRA
ncbi:MAG: undecaprenyl/decaprenyl-phosphate alpha-N-acetylglucosaminyl 1-phosphate transferase [Anaerolineales bacterium]|nr:undecaprenyl/decaprenyl-phosphate alpha-N-acetylglucosaminyl 1-phosphate transferase [Anaerolineales bacterium]MCB8950913.1 undecaprenyl/decaprenyl-phosphate alpha-N-acetylglucosaminyl 1-phosphate transferase [Ardenticatenales bacterium]